MIVSKSTSVDYKTRSCYQQKRQRKFFTDKLFFIINVIKNSHWDQI